MVSAETLRLMTQGEDHYLVGPERRRNPRVQVMLQAARRGSPCPRGARCRKSACPAMPPDTLLGAQSGGAALGAVAAPGGDAPLPERASPAGVGSGPGAPPRPGEDRGPGGGDLQGAPRPPLLRLGPDPEGRFRFWVDRGKLRVEGTYILQTNEPALDPSGRGGLQTSRRWSGAFPCLKDVMAVRPIYHRTARVRGSEGTCSWPIWRCCWESSWKRRCGGRSTVARDGPGGPPLGAAGHPGAGWAPDPRDHQALLPMTRPSSRPWGCLGSPLSPVVKSPERECLNHAGFNPINVKYSLGGWVATEVGRRWVGRLRSWAILAAPLLVYLAVLA